MIGTHLDAVFADGYARGIKGWDAEAAYAAMRRNSFEEGDGGGFGRLGIKEFESLGYVPSDTIHHGASRTMDFAYNDWCVAQLAQDFGTAEEKEVLLRRADNYRNTFDPDVGFMRGRKADGTWMEPFDPFDWGGPFVEGSVYQCGWAVNHAPRGLAELMGGPEAMGARLDELFTLPPRFSAAHYSQQIHEMAEMASVDFGQYAHSNQPSHHVLYLYAAIGQPWKTQYWTRRVLDELYSWQEDGLSGDEDNGEMSGWYILNAMGIYPLCPGHPSFVLGSPLFPKLTLHREDGTTLTIHAPGNSPESLYVDKVQLDGKDKKELYLTQEEMTTARELTFTMTTQPRDDRTYSEKELPYSFEC